MNKINGFKCSNLTKFKKVCLSVSIHDILKNVEVVIIELDVHIYMDHEKNAIDFGRNRCNSTGLTVN